MPRHVWVFARLADGQLGVVAGLVIFVAVGAESHGLVNEDVASACGALDEAARAVEGLRRLDVLRWLNEGASEAGSADFWLIVCGCRDVAELMELTLKDAADNVGAGVVCIISEAVDSDGQLRAA
jgi:hypothetical protein